MNLFASPRYLPLVLRLDAASCAATGLLQLLAAPELAAWFGLSPALLATTGWLLLGVAAYALWASLAPLRRPAVWVMVAGNVAWALGCLDLLFSGAAATGLGQAWLAFQAAVTLLLAELEWTGLRRAPAAAWA